MKILWAILAAAFGALALLALLRVGEKALTGTLTGQAGVQVALVIVFGLLAWKTFSKARARKA